MMYIQFLCAIYWAVMLFINIRLLGLGHRVEVTPYFITLDVVMLIVAICNSLQYIYDREI